MEQIESFRVRSREGSQKVVLDADASTGTPRFGALRGRLLLDVR